MCGFIAVALRQVVIRPFDDCHWAVPTYFPRPVPKLDRTRSSRFSAAEAEQTTESIATSNRAEAILVMENVINQGIVQPLMVPLVVVQRPHIIPTKPNVGDSSTGGTRSSTKSCSCMARDAGQTW